MENWEGKSVFNWESVQLKQNVLYCRYSQLYVSHMCKRILRLELEVSSYWQNIKFSQNWPKFHIFIWIIIFQVYLQLFWLLHPYKFYGRDMLCVCQEYSFIFASCEPLTLGRFSLKHGVRGCSKVLRCIFINFGIPMGWFWNCSRYINDPLFLWWYDDGLFCWWKW